MTTKKKANKGLAALTAVPIGIKVIRKGEPIPEPSDAPVEGAEAYEVEVKDPKDHQTIADRLDYLLETLGGGRHYRERERLDDDTLGDVVLKIKLADGGTVLAGKGETTAHAFNALLDKVTRFTKAGLHKETN